ncbi:cAMP-mediated signaling protein sok1 [Dipsacomyces acuminosporus]|nr:cAMP-mediated signaling protein sok1 [Dipsacomyces acuminosporus]
MAVGTISATDDASTLYTLRELKIQNILQNPRLRHEVLFEPKLEFRPNSSGHLAEAKQRAAMQYWAAIEHGLQGWLSDSSPLHNRNNERQQCVAPGMSAVPVLIVELREILAEMAEDSPKHELVQYAQELRERLDEDVIRQQIQHNVFDPVPVVTYMASVMRQFAQCERYAAVDRLVAYVRRGRFVRALRSAFDVLEAIKIDIANSSIEMYREYMRSTAVAFERSHFNMDLRRNNIALEDTAEWWQRALASGKRYHISLDDIFYEASRELILDDGQNVPGLFRMDEARIHLIRRELERMSIVGVVFLAFAQFLQLASRNKAPQPLSSTATAIDRSEFKSASGRVDFQRLAGECMLLVPEGCSVQWSEPLIAASASPMPLPAVSAAAAATAQLPPFADKASSSVTPARGSEISFSRLVGQLVSLAERTLGRAVGPNEVAILERTLLRSARYECPLREIVEDRVNSTIRTHTQALASLNGKLKGNEWEEMPASAKDLLRRSMLGFLAPGLATLAVKIHSVTTHHWHVYKAYYASLSSSSSSSPSSSSSSSSTSCPSHADNSDSSSSSSLQAVQ